MLLFKIIGGRSVGKKIDFLRELFAVCIVCIYAPPLDFSGLLW